MERELEKLVFIGNKLSFEWFTREGTLFMYWYYMYSSIIAQSVQQNINFVLDLPLRDSAYKDDISKEAGIT